MSMKSFSQQKISGTIKDVNGLPLPGVSISQVGASKIGTASDKDGKYELNTIVNARIVFTYQGFEKQTIQVEANKSIVNIVLKVSDKIDELDDVIIIGYGSQKKSDVTGAISSVNLKGIDESGATNINQVLEGRTAGVQVSNNIGVPGSEVDIVIRGRSSISTASAPLYVVDGILLDEELPSRGFATPMNPLQSISPEDIESIQVLKDASATGIYGSRGANGVILITTKSGKAGKGKITFNSWVSAYQIRERVDVLRPEEFAQAWNDSRYPLPAFAPSLFPYDSLTGRVLFDSLTLIDWQDDFIRTSISQNYRLGFSGGSNGNSHYISMGALLVDGIIAGTGSEKYDITGNFKNKINDWLSVTTNINAARINNTFSQGSDPNAGKFGMLNSIIQTRPAFSSAAEILTDDGDLDPNAEFNGAATPQAWLKEYQDLTLTTTVRAALGMEVKLSKDFKFKSSVGINNNNSVKQFYFSRNHNRGRTNGGEGHKIDRKAFSYVMDNLLFYNKKINKSNQIDVTTGVTYNKYTTENLSITATGFPDDFLLGDYISAGAVQQIGDGYEEYSIMSYLGRVNYKYKRSIDLTATLRADGVSKFNPGNQWGYFPSFGAGYNLHNESFMKSSKLISKLRLRGGWGQVGNSSVPPYSTINVFNYIRSSDANGVPVTNIVPASKGNPDLTWELADQYNVALEFGLLNNNIIGSVDLYYKTTKNQLFNQPLPASAGFNSQWINLGEVLNKGIEIELKANNLLKSKKNMTLSVGGNFSLNRNKILDLGRGPDEFGKIGFLGRRINDFNINTPANIFLVGQPVGLFWGYRTNGIIQKGESGPSFNGIALTEGDIRFVDIRGEVGNPEPDGVVTRADQTIIGDPNPDFLYALFSDFSYKNFSISVLFSGSQGADIMNGTSKYTNRFLASGSQVINQNFERDKLVNAWTPDNPSNRYPRVGFTNSTDNGQILDRDIEDGSYLKLQTLNIGYSFKINRSPVESARLYFTGQNLFYWTKYSGLNPEIGRSQGGLLGIDYNQWPVAKSYQLGLNLTF